jgi:hypothetical protein
MIVLEEPYVSNTLLSFLEEEQVPVLKNDFSERISLEHPKLNILDEQSIIKLYNSSSNFQLYTSSEYALDWIYGALPEKRIIDQVTLLKDKVLFRKACHSLYEDMIFTELSYTDLFSFNISEIDLPVVLKPSVGFLSAGVFVITSMEDWENALTDIKINFKKQAALFPEKVVGNSLFIIESYITGKEFAIDLYFKDTEPVIINIFEHLFSSQTDVSDRLYRTNKALFDDYLSVFTKHISNLNKVLNLKDIPVHIELRVEGDRIVPIEINPLRFTGLCLNEIHYHIAGKHPLSYFFSKTTPDYHEMWKGKEEKTFSFSIFDKPKDSVNKRFDTEKVKHLFSKILEFRPVNNPKLNINAFVFSETSSLEQKESKIILNLDMSQTMIGLN